MIRKAIEYRAMGLRTFAYAFMILAGIGLLMAALPVESPAADPGVGHMIPASFAEVAAKVSPAVVNVSTVRRVQETGGYFRFNSPEGGRDPFQEFFERFFGGQAPPRQREQRSLGSGFIIDPNGLCITNNHVIEDATDIVVTLSNEKEYHAKVLGRDPKTDLALIKIEADVKFPFVELGDSDKIRVGDWVVAIGNPFGLQHTVTAGILSAKGRAIGAGPYDDFLQTDASINPGNSGGPLLNLEGEVIGINTAIVAGGQGIGFAIPTSLAKNIVGQLRSEGRVIRGWLGVIIQQIDPELAKAFKLQDKSGALVADVAPGGPAAEAGLKSGDVIISFDGRKIANWSDLPVIVAGTPVGKPVDVIVIRNGQEKTFKVEVGELPEEETAAAPARAEDLGLNVRELTPELAKQLGIPESEGVIIAGIADDSPAAEAGLKPGDLILEMNRQTIKDIGDYQRIARQVKKGDTVLFLIRRGQIKLFRTMEMN